LVLCKGDKVTEAAGGRRGVRRRGGVREEDPGWLARRGRDRRDPRSHGRGRQTGQGPGPARSDAESEERHGDVRRDQGGQGAQGGQDRVPRRQGLQRSCPGRQGLVHRREAARERHDVSARAGTRASRGDQGARTSRA
jgi:hypothetical protein